MQSDPVSIPVESVEHALHDVALSDSASSAAEQSSPDRTAAHDARHSYGVHDGRDGWTDRRDSAASARSVDPERGLNAHFDHTRDRSAADGAAAAEADADDGTFEAVELDREAGARSDGPSQSDSPSGSPADTTTPPHSPSLASTAPTTVADPGSSNHDIALSPPVTIDGTPVPGPSSPLESKPPTPAARPKVRPPAWLHPWR